MSWPIKQVFDDKTGNLVLTCLQCGKPITHTNEYGMFCDSECGLEECKKGVNDLQNFLNGMEGMFKP